MNTAVEGWIADSSVCCPVCGSSDYLVHSNNGKTLCLADAKQFSLYAGALCFSIKDKEGHIHRFEILIKKDNVNLSVLESLPEISGDNGRMFFTKSFIPPEILPFI